MTMTKFLTSCSLDMLIKHVQEKEKEKRNLIVKEKEHSFISTSLQLQHWKNKDNDFLCQLCFLSLQWNLLTADILYRGHLSTTDFFLSNGWNDAQTLKAKPLCSWQFIANTSLQWTSLLGPKSHYHLELTSQ